VPRPQVLLTTFFILVMFAADFARPGHGDAGPLAAGLALYAILSTGEWAAARAARPGLLSLTAALSLPPFNTSWLAATPCCHAAAAAAPPLQAAP
jgi:hypothetical protein